MAIVFWTFVLYGLLFLYLALSSEDASEPVAEPVRLPVRSPDSTDDREVTELAG